MVFLTNTMAFLPNGCFLAETILKGSIHFVLMAFTGIMGMHAPKFLAQHTAFLESHLPGDLVVAGICTLVLAFLVLSSGFLRAFFHGLFLGVRIHYNFSMLSRTTTSFLTFVGSTSWLRLLVPPRLGTQAKEKAC
jgi:hypothetical protein